MDAIFQLFWLFVIFSSLAPMLQQRMLTFARLQLLRGIEKKRGSRVITLILADLAAKALRQVEETVFGLVQEPLDEARGRDLARTLTDGRWTHDYPLTAVEAKHLGLPVRTGLPEEIFDLMRLYPQPAQRRPSVEYVPAHYHSAPNDGISPRPGMPLRR
jgi:ClpP class serine protease